MAWLDKNTVENLLVLLIGVLLFNGLTNIKFIGDNFRKYPLLIVGIAVILVALSDKIASGISFMEKNATKGLIYLVAGILLFNGMVNTKWVLPYFVQYPYIIIGIALFLLIFKDKISETLGG